ncbi:HNH endonuclease family protein, partial [Bradyrhizobium cosmicum]|uniref:HNH endonuclease family protein n=1 Tax=Bradyrhizobium cosmicum TaxID=1404864 RepID=UPI0039656993
MENLDSNDTRDIANGIEDGSLTIEHVMPQTLTQAWHDELGDEAQRIHEQWLNRLGNLTVTGYNSSYSNSSYSTKRTMKHGFME